MKRKVVKKRMRQVIEECTLYSIKTELKNECFIFSCIVRG